MELDMKLLKVIIISISIILSITPVIADNHTPGETKQVIGKMPPPIWLDDPQIDFPAFLWRLTQYMGMRLKKQEKHQHQSAVFFMLENARDGEVVSWFSDKRLANGKVRVIHTYPISGGYCRTYQAFIKIRTKQKHMTNNACKYIGSPSWSFYK
jgi:hypothetical protein